VTPATPTGKYRSWPESFGLDTPTPIQIKYLHHNSSISKPSRGRDIASLKNEVYLLFITLYFISAAATLSEAVVKCDSLMDVLNTCSD